MVIGGKVSQVPRHIGGGAVGDQLADSGLLAQVARDPERYGIQRVYLASGFAVIANNAGVGVYDLRRAVLVAEGDSLGVAHKRAADLDAVLAKASFPRQEELTAELKVSRSIEDLGGEPPALFLWATVASVTALEPTTTIVLGLGSVRAEAYPQARGVPHHVDVAAMLDVKMPHHVTPWRGWRVNEVGFERLEERPLALMLKLYRQALERR